MNERPIAYVLVGLPCSGKSHWAFNHPDKHEIASTDMYVEQMADEEGESYGDVFENVFRAAQIRMKHQVSRIIKEKKSFIWDQTNITREQREKIYSLLHHTHKVVYVCFLVPLHICLGRLEKRSRNDGVVVNEQRIIELAKKIVFPTEAEPHDQIVRLIHPEWLNNVVRENR